MTINTALLIPTAIRTAPQLARIRGGYLRPIQLAPSRAARMIDHIARGVATGLRARAAEVTEPAEVNAGHRFAVIDKALTRC